MTTEQVAVVLDDAGFDAPADVGVLSRDHKGAADVVRFSYSDEWLEAVIDTATE